MIHDGRGIYIIFTMDCFSQDMAWEDMVAGTEVTVADMVAVDTVAEVRK